MANSVFNMLNGNISQKAGFSENLNALKSNPFQFLAQRRLNIPNNMSNPEDIVKFWLDNGTMSQDQFNQLQGRVNQIMGQR